MGLRRPRGRPLKLTLSNVLAAALLACGPGFAQPSGPPGSSPPAGTDWPNFGNDLANTKYSPLDQIDRDNFDRLEIAWRWESISKKIAAENDQVIPAQFKVVPIIVDGTMYVATELSQVAAIDAGSGTLVWQFDPESWRAGRPANVGFQRRGLAHWQQGDDARIFITTHDRRLLALDTKTGRPVAGFGDGGFVDLLPESGLRHFGRKINHRLITHSSPPAIAGNTVIVGSIVHDGAVRQAAAPGHVRGFDALTGEMKWIFHTIPQEGEPGVETWESESWRYTGHTNVWSMMAVDEELGTVYLPTGTPTDDFYGGHRLGDNLYAESLVCLDADTGEKIWHFQAVHHGLWDYDFPTAPNLIDITVDGRRIKAVAQVSKQAFTYVFDRATGEPVWPIEERPVPQSNVPGERTSPTQPFPTKPPPFDRQGTSEDQLVDFTPEIRKEAIEIASAFKLGPLYTPPMVATEDERAVLFLPSAGGGANWPGAAFDPETGILYVPSSTGLSGTPLTKPDPSRSNLAYTGSFSGGAPGPQGLPLVKPPWGRVTAIDMNRGEHVWMTPNGYGPRSLPALEGLDVGLLGGGSGAPLVTKTLLFVTQRRGLGDENTPRINVFDKANGDLLGHIPLPEAPNGNPVTYLHEGRQYLVVAVGGGPFFGGYSDDAKEIDPGFAERLKLMSQFGTTTKPELIALRLP